MKKLLSITAILWCILCVWSCRESDKETSYPNLENFKKNQEPDRSQILAGDSLKAPGINDPDPPIKDGQDWRMGNGNKK
ncbi:hypothetical protein [Chryseobacterium salivictor]|uniref:Uncharacterized protein n=1 Tax=Chryseobacterium salivictor TaxID=2547600 RepID=A0A4P6ZHS3_9FLAO|nr:hypothetical protein [Chryseobacterium salivictor]QBO59340.1 hypothetical protein NBC122_02536 [Chryseobacterium salivictor]